MFDDFPTADNARLKYHWPDKIAPGDIASFVWPRTGASNGTTATPCLVINVIKILGCTYFELAHGAPDRPHSSAGYQIIVNREVDVLWSHLPIRFRFDCRFRVLVPPLHPNFQKVDNTPLIGRLPDRLID